MRAIFITVIMCVLSRFSTIVRKGFFSPDSPRTFKAFRVSDARRAGASVTVRPDAHRGAMTPKAAAQ